MYSKHPQRNTNWYSKNRNEFLSEKETIHLDGPYDELGDYNYLDYLNEMLDREYFHFTKIDDWGDTYIVPLKEMIEQITKSYKDKYGDKCDEFYVLKKEVK